MTTVCLDCEKKFELTCMTVWRTEDQWGNKEIVIVCPHCKRRHTI